MSGAGLGTNAAKVPNGGNNTRPGGASPIAESADPETLRFAIATGNRQTRRLARKNLRKAQRMQP